MTRELKPLLAKVEHVHHIIGKKWVNLIIHVLMEGTKRFSELHNIIPDLSKRMLNERLKELEECGLISREVIPDRPVRTEYSLTAKGQELGTALLPVEAWAMKWL
ncbi:HxlR family transcriptional regulator [Paenibacillus sp. IHB B 3415]|jgi:DNA-binding HxlR family transcriptional regulator|uniref:winged helix-turn-helix transcriptional regulator n=1 Tax=Paenibacillus sp. IHB B 3415 TaxID=867080 RepID=UPI00057494E4|nr:helix-turn-helix domain-containing protein [Paenibacillus sp. IHB B 3415]KHL96597.1 HxlR family transcriptional regulator [Paenibacillus sp. IHB B 3415]